jgi:hypothetical protein
MHSTPSTIAHARRQTRAAAAGLSAASWRSGKVARRSNWIAKGSPEAEVRKMLVDLYGRLIDGIVRVAS